MLKEKDEWQEDLFFHNFVFFFYKCNIMQSFNNRYTYFPFYALVIVF